MRKLVLIVALFALCGAIAACNTFQGFGRDLSATGHAVSGAAKG